MNKVTVSGCRSIAGLLAAAVVTLAFAAAHVHAAQQPQPAATDGNQASLPRDDRGTLVDQLRLSAHARSFPYLWVPNNDDIVSKMQAETGEELRRYRTCPAGSRGKPSRGAARTRSGFVSARQARGRPP